MNYLITESQSSVVRRELKRSIEEIGFYRTKKKFRLNMDMMDRLLSGEYFPELDCGDLNDIIWELFKNGLVDYEYNTYLYNIRFYSDDMVGSIYFVCTDRNRDDKITGYATPYWDGVCKLPLEVNFYNYKDSETGYDEELEVDPGGFYEEEPLEMKFNSFSEIKDWFNNKYMKMVSEYCESAFDYVRYL